jgi:hypothetical protein
MTSKAYVRSPGKIIEFGTKDASAGQLISASKGASILPVIRNVILEENALVQPAMLEVMGNRVEAFPRSRL